MTVAPPIDPPDRRAITDRVAPWLVQDVRRIAAVSAAGFVAGFVVNGWGSRFAMMLLAKLNPQATGRISDDGFRMGQFVLGDTLGLVAFTTLLGVVGGLLFLVVRDLRFGPAWFRTASMTVGPAVVVGSMLVHTDGVDFRILEPVWLAIALFVALPGLFAYAVSKLADRWLDEGSRFLRGARGWWVPLLLLVPFWPLLVVAGLGLLFHAIYRDAGVRKLLPPRAVAGVARVGLVAVFVLALGALVRDTVTLL